MRIKQINISELGEFIHSGEYLSYDTIPITPDCAFSQAKNPHAKPDDPALWLALSNENKLLGFIGSLPAMDYRSGQRMGWNSCWWVDPKKGKDAAMPLFNTFLKYWDMQVAFSDMTPDTYSFVREMDFCHTREEQIYIGYFRLSFKEAFLSPKRLPYPLAPLFAILVPIVNFFQSFRLSLFSINLKGLEMEVKEQDNEEIRNFIGQNNAHDFSGRRTTDFDWILSQKWLSEENAEASEIGDRYPFSYLCKQFDWKWIITRLDGKINSVMLVSLRDHTLKVLYYYGDSPGFALMALKSIVAGDQRIRKIIFSHPKLINNSRMLNPVLILKRIKNRYVGVSKKMMDEFPPDLIMQLGDGDGVFI